MTKSSKHKSGKAADFSKKKLKLGKGKQAATNSIDTSFKARSIALPQQSIAITKDASAPTTKRKLNLDDLLAHLKHYAAGVRKDALQGLHELLSEHQALIEQNLSKLVNACVRLISDEDASVRKALYIFLAWILPRIPREHLSPYAPTLLLFTASAQSHIFPEIRIDAIRILDLLLESIPEQVVAGFGNNGSGQTGHGRKVLDGYLGLLNVGVRFGEDDSKAAGPSSGIGGQSMTLITLSAASKASVLKSFATFLLRATEQASQANSNVDYSPKGSIPLWYLAPSFGSSEAFKSFTGLLSPRRTGQPTKSQTSSWTPSVELESYNDDFIGRLPLSDMDNNSGPTFSLLDMESVLEETRNLQGDDTLFDELNSSNARLFSSLCRTVQPVLISTFLDCAPAVFSPTQVSPEAELELVHSVMEIARCLNGRLLRDDNAAQDQVKAAHEGLKALIDHISVYFPFCENRMIVHDLKTENTLQQMNLIFCELYSLQSLNHASPDESGLPNAKRRKLNNAQMKRSKAAGAPNHSDKQAERVRDYVVQCLRGTTPTSSSSVMHPLGQTITAQTYIALLPTLWWLLDRNNDESKEVLSAVLHHATNAGSASGVKLAATEFIGCLVLLQSEPSYKGSLKMNRFISEGLQKLLRSWLFHLPKVLWELGDKNLTATELILLFILRLTQRRSWLNDVETSIALCTRFTPFFAMQHATRGQLIGPYARLNKMPTAAISRPALESKNEAEERSTSTIGLNPMKRLALDLAAMLVSVSATPATQEVLGVGQQHPPAPRNLPPHQARRAGSGGVGNSVAIPAEVEESRAGLRRAVEKAVAGTAEETYWLGVSKL